jgi:hypothetical protein
VAVGVVAVVPVVSAQEPPPERAQVSPPPGTPGAPPVVVGGQGGSTSPSFVTALSAEQKAAAKSIIAESVTDGGTLRPLVGNASYQVADIGPLTQGTDGGSLRTIGAVVRVELSTPQSVDVVVPATRAPWPGTEEYVPYHARLIGQIKDLLLLVDLRKGRLVSVKPSFMSTVDRYEPVPGTGPLPPLSKTSD